MLNLPGLDCLTNLRTAIGIGSSADPGDRGPASDRVIPPMPILQPAACGRRIRMGWVLPLCLALVTGRLARAEEKSGDQVYRSRALVPRRRGEGSKEYPARAHRRQVGRPARQADREDHARGRPRDLLGEDARRVAAYIYDAFYSKTAQARNKPARLELSRLTVRQYRNARDRPGRGVPLARRPRTTTRGLKGEYYKSRRTGRNSDRVIERIDPGVRFDFGVEAPAPDKFDPKEFSIVWHGSVLAPETGEYEFIVRTENSTRLHVNDLKRP